MTFSRGFYRSVAVCSVLSAGTTLLLIFMPRLFAPGASFDARMARVNETAYIVRAWAYLVHPFLAVAAAAGVAASLRRKAGGIVSLGFLGFLLWGFTEAAQQALTVVAFDRWRRAYLVAEEPARAVLRAQIGVYDAVWDSMFLLLLIAFLIGNLLYGLVLLREDVLGRIVGFFYFAAAGLTLTDLLGEFQVKVLPEALEFWIYPALQPLARVLIGVWLWRVAPEVSGEPTASRPSSART
jgi:hypothetical protein